MPCPPVPVIGAFACYQFSSRRVLCSRISHFPQRDGIHIQMLIGGDQAYPAIIAAIDGATQSIALQTYMFDDDSEGQKIAQALSEAHARGVEVRDRKSTRLNSSH